MKKIICIALLAFGLSNLSFASVNPTKKISRCVEKILSSRNVNEDLLRKLAILLSDVELNEPNYVLSACQAFKDEGKMLDRINFEEFKRITDKLYAESELTDSMKNLLTEVAFPTLECTITGMQAQAGVVLGGGAGLYIGKCVDKINRKAQVLVPSVSINASIGAMIILEKIEMNYVLGRDPLVLGSDMLPTVAGIDKGCQGSSNNCVSRFEMGLFAGVVGEVLIPITLNVQNLNFETIINNN